MPFPATIQRQTTNDKRQTTNDKRQTTADGRGLSLSFCAALKTASGRSLPKTFEGKLRLFLIGGG